MQKLLRDVFVNVIANLIAAYIVYLLGVLAGIFPRNETLIRVVAASITGGSGNLLYALILIIQATSSRSSSANSQAMGWGAVALGVLTLLSVFAGQAMVFSYFWMATYSLSGVGIILLGGAVAIQGFVQRKMI